MSHTRLILSRLIQLINSARTKSRNSEVSELLDQALAKSVYEYEEKFPNEHQHRLQLRDESGKFT